eukprot:gene808-4748_t
MAGTAAGVVSGSGCWSLTQLRTQSSNVGAGGVAQSVGGPMVGRVRAACMSTMHITHYDVLKVELDATASDIKKAYLALSMKLHPDRNPDKGAALHFQAAKEAYEVLSCAEQKQQYDLGMAVVGGAGGGRGAAGASRGETILESELRTAVESGDVDSAVGKWVASGSSLKLLLFFIDALQRHKKLPTNLPELLTHLHATEASTGTGGSGAAQMPVSTEKAAFVERKTTAYNELIRLCHMCEQKEQLFTVLDQMENNKIQVDMTTWMFLEEAFSWKS